MIYIFTDEFQDDILTASARVEGLSDAICIEPITRIDPGVSHIIIENSKLIIPIPWDSVEPPVLFESSKFEEEDLIAILLCKLGYEKEALSFVKNSAISEAIHVRLILRSEDQQQEALTAFGDHYFSLHNRAVLSHYTGLPINGETAEKLYEMAIVEAPSDEHKAFTAKQLAIFMIDHGEANAAEKLLRHYQKIALSDAAKYYIQLDLIHVLMSSLSFLKDKEKGNEIKQQIWEALQYFEEHDISWAIANLYTMASEIANFEKSYSESLSYISKAIEIYEDGFPEFLASAFIRKGTLLYTWAQDGNPQFYQPAIDTYHEALKTFTREYAPGIFSEIHHNLAVIYAEMPVDEQKKGMWSAFSATSFKEALNFYKKDKYPFEYAMVANNYANALLKYPPAKMGDNIEKAIYYYTEALEIRSADQFSEERAYTILNYLEACWQVHNINKNMEQARYKDMLTKAREIKALTDDENLLQQAKFHLDELSALGLAIMKN